MNELNAKDFANDKIDEILQLCTDLFYVENKELKRNGLEKIEKLALGIREHLEYLELKEE